MLQYDRFLESLPLGVGVNRESHSPLRLNVGFVLHESVGFSRVFEFDHPLVQVAGEFAVKDLHGDLRLTRTAQGIYLEGTLHCSYPVECSRCLEPIDQALAPELAELFVYPPDKAEDPILTIPETGILDLNPLLREMMLLNVPLQPVCRPECRGLCPVCGNNRNEQECSHPQESIDPRFAPLKSLLGDA